MIILAYSTLMENHTEKEKTIFDFIPKVMPLIDFMLIVLVACTSPNPWITTPINMGLPIVAVTVLHLFKNKGRIGFYIIGTAVCIPNFILNLWCSPSCPTWLNVLTFIIGGLMLAITLSDALVVLSLALCSTTIPLYLSGNTFNFIITVAMAELIIWFMMERCMKFLYLQKQKVEAQKKEIEEKNKDILDSIRYARRIQQSLLPAEKYIHRILKTKND